jgi:GTP-binding protein
MTLRNIAIIAHVDHGKTTLVDGMFKQSGMYRDNESVEDCAMDSNDIEKERGITIFAKCTAVEWGDHRINIVDTPGHADFGGEVERILSMVDGVILLVDSAEGPMPQTKFVTGKALALGLNPIVIINKIDKADRRPDEVHDEIFDLFVSLEANDQQLDFPMLYASGRDGWASNDLDGSRENLDPLFKSIIDYYDKPAMRTKEIIDQPFTMLSTLLDRDNFMGRVLTGRIQTGKISVNDPIKVLNQSGETVETGRATKLMSFEGLQRVPVDAAIAGDIIAIAGLKIATVADTICDAANTIPLQAQPIDPPTLSMRFSVNDSPIAGREGTKVTSRMIRDRLERESEGNVAIQITESDGKDSFDVAGRGELQLGVLIETMRREGFELSISRPRVIYREDETGSRTEPYEEVVIDVDEEYSGVVVEKMAERKSEMTDMRASGAGKSRITFLAPSRGLIGYHGEFLTDTRGTGIMNRTYHSYGVYKGPLQGRRVGVLISMGGGKAVAYALWGLEDRGTILINPQEEVYEGMIIGEHARANDLDVNVLKGKQLTNIRASGKDDAIKLTPPRKLSLEQAIAYIQDDELVEITPENIRLRKRFLVPHERKKAARAGKA